MPALSLRNSAQRATCRLLQPTPPPTSIAIMGNRPNIYFLFSRFGNQPFSTRLR